MTAPCADATRAQLYNEEVNDLLAPSNAVLKIQEDATRGVTVAGLSEFIVGTPQQVLELMAKGDSNKHIAATRMNKQSSRSHTVFQMACPGRTLPTCSRAARALSRTRTAGRAERESLQARNERDAA